MSDPWRSRAIVQVELVRPDPSWRGDGAGPIIASFNSWRSAPKREALVTEMTTQTEREWREKFPAARDGDFVRIVSGISPMFHSYREHRTYIVRGDALALAEGATA